MAVLCVPAVSGLRARWGGRGVTLVSPSVRKCAAACRPTGEGSTELSRGFSQNILMKIATLTSRRYRGSFAELLIRRILISPPGSYPRASWPPTAGHVMRRQRFNGRASHLGPETGGRVLRGTSGKTEHYKNLKIRVGILIMTVFFMSDIGYIIY